MMGERKTLAELTFSSPNKLSWGNPKFIERNKLSDIKEGESILVKVEMKILKTEEVKIKTHLIRKAYEVIIPFNGTYSSFSNHFEAFGLILFFFLFFISDFFSYAMLEVIDKYPDHYGLYLCVNVCVFFFIYITLLNRILEIKIAYYLL
jgi:hypothetical protein